MANTLVKAQFMDPPGGPNSSSPLGAVKAGTGITISTDGTISTSSAGGTVTNVICSNGIQGGGQGPQVFLSLLPPEGTSLGGVRTLDGSGLSIDSAGIIRATNTTQITSSNGILVTNQGGGNFVLDLRTPGNNSSALGGVYVPVGAGLTAATDGRLTLNAPTSTVIGGVKAGTGVTIAADGTLNATGTGGTITGVGAGTGLGGGGITGAVTLFLQPATSNTIGGVYPGENVTIDPDGRINVSDAALGVLTVTGNDPIVITGTVTNPTVTINSASTSQSGAVTLSNLINSTSDTLAATPLAVKTVADIANAALPAAGGTLTGPVTFTAGQTFPGTVSSSAFTQLGGILVGDTSPPGYAQLPVGTNGYVLSANSAQPLGLEWVVAGQGTVTNVTGTAPVQVATGTTTPVISVSAASDSAAGVVRLESDPLSTSTATAPSSFALSVVNQVALNGLPRTGGTMTGAINFSAGQTFPGTLPLAGGTMTGNITFSGTQTFPGVLAQGNLSGTSPITVGGTLSNPIISIDKATSGSLGVVQPDGTTITINGSGVISAVGSGSAPTLQQVTTAGATTTSSITVGGLIASGLTYPSTDGTAGQALTTNGTGTLSFTSVLPLAGGTLTGAFQITDGTFNYIQFFPDGRAYMEGPVGINVVPDPLFPLTLEGNYRSFGNDLLAVYDNTGGTAGTLAIRQSGILSTSISDSVGGSTVFMTHTAGKDLILGSSGVQYLKIDGTDGQITFNSSTAGAFSFPTSQGAAGQILQSDGAGNVVWATNLAAGCLPLTGGTMTGTITFAAGQTISGYVANSLYASTGALTYASGASTPATLNVGANGNILGVSAGLPAWRTAAQLGLLTTAAASTTYATIDSPSFTGPATVNAGAGAGGNALTISGGNLVLATQFTPPSSSSTGSVGELAWDNAGYLYFCYAANTWGRVQIDLTPF